jgi:hypothetical protein
VCLDRRRSVLVRDSSLLARNFKRLIVENENGGEVIICCILRTLLCLWTSAGILNSVGGVVYMGSVLYMATRLICAGAP